MSAAPLRGAMLLAAGKGERLRPLTESRPKPLIEVAGRALIDHALDRLVEAGIGRVVVNSHYRADQLEAHLADRDDIEIAISREESLLDTGGGVCNALALLGEGPFLVANTDVLWLDGPENTLARLAAAWRDETMDALLLMHEMVRAGQFEGKGDFLLDAAGIARRRAWHEVAPFLFSGVQILHSRLFEAAPAGAFSLNRLFDSAGDAMRLHGMVHDGLWLHVGTPEGLAVADKFLREGRGG
jgi:N-acetyl-alpha-D-muramate 1-phosphate uridylyltransferase